MSLIWISVRVSRASVPAFGWCGRRHFSMLDVDSNHCRCDSGCMSDLGADPLAALRPLELPLDGLEQQLAVLLDSIEAPLPDGRIAARPDVRTLRWYQSRGLIPKPLRYDGRQAIYGYPHIIGALGVKLLQGAGLRLDQVQEHLAGVSFSTIESLARDALLQAGAGGLARARPAPPHAPGPAPTPLRVLHTVELMPGVLLTIDPIQVVDPDALVRRLRGALTAGAHP